MAHMGFYNMSQKDNKAVTNWLLIVCGLIMFMVVFGGAVRLTRSGLSIVEWNPISGIIPPIGDEAWQQEFAKYQQTPEFQKINQSMTLTGYKEIFLLEYIHRLVARFAGLIVAIPLLRFLLKGIIPWRKSAHYIGIGLLFAFQGYLGWYMVSSGLVDHPSVSHLRLTFHLLTALLLLGLASWAALNHIYSFPARAKLAERKRPFRLSIILMVTLIIQIAYGGFMAGLKAGHVSNTWPLMFGRLVPSGLFEYLEPWWHNLFSTTTTVHFIHRWFAIVVLLASIAIYYLTRNQGYAPALNKGIAWMVGLTAAQTALGISVIWFQVPLVLALSHQALALALFLAAIYINYHVLHQVAAQSVPAESKQAAAAV